MQDQITLHLIYPTKTTTQQIRELELETATGTRVILPGHAPLYAALKHGSMINFIDATGTLQSEHIGSALAAINRSEIRIIMSHT